MSCVYLTNCKIMNRTANFVKTTFLIAILISLTFPLIYGNNHKAEPQKKSENANSLPETSQKQQKKSLKLQKRILRKQLLKKERVKQGESGFKVFLMLVLLPLTVIGGLVKLFAIILGTEISIGALALISLGLYGIFVLAIYIILLTSLGNS